MDINHKVNIGANKNDTFAVPKRWTLNKPTKITSDIAVTTSAEITFQH